MCGLLRRLLYIILFFAFVVLLLYFWAICGECDGFDREGARLPDGRSYYVVGSTRYNSKALLFNINPMEAAAIVRKHIENAKEGVDLHLGTRHVIILEDEYVFSIPEKMGVSLAGYWVNGFTGELRKSDEFYSIPSLCMEEGDRSFVMKP